MKTESAWVGSAWPRDKAHPVVWPIVIGHVKVELLNETTVVMGPESSEMPAPASRGCIWIPLRVKVPSMRALYEYWDAPTRVAKKERRINPERSFMTHCDEREKINERVQEEKFEKIGSNLRSYDFFQVHFPERQTKSEKLNNKLISAHLLDWLTNQSEECSARSNHRCDSVSIFSRDFSI